MKITITGKQIGLTDGLKARVEERFSKLDKYFYKEADAFVTLSVQREEQVVEATIHSGGLILRVEESTTDMYTSIDNAVEILERQLRKNKTRIQKRMRKEYIENVVFDRIMPDPEISQDENDLDIIRTKRIESKPMTPEEAVLQMDLLGHNFYIFTNGSTGGTNVVYRRKNGGYGLIEVD